MLAQLSPQQQLCEEMATLVAEGRRDLGLGRLFRGTWVERHQLRLYIRRRKGIVMARKFDSWCDHRRAELETTESGVDLLPIPSRPVPFEITVGGSLHVYQ